MQTTSLNTLKTAAETARKVLGLKYSPVVARNEATATRIAERWTCGVVMLGDDAYWVVCLADAQRLARAGYEYAM